MWYLCTLLFLYILHLEQSQWYSMVRELEVKTSMWPRTLRSAPQYSLTMLRWWCTAWGIMAAWPENEISLLPFQVFEKHFTVDFFLATECWCLLTFVPQGRILVAWYICKSSSPKLWAPMSTIWNFARILLSCQTALGRISKMVSSWHWKGH